MGYSMHQIDSNFHIAADKKAAAFAALKSLKGKETCPGFQGESHFSYVDAKECNDSTCLEEALASWRWIAHVENDDDTKSIFQLEFIGQSTGDEDLLFSVIAPFVTAGSSITMLGEEGLIWRWIFDGQKVTKDYGRVVFDERSQNEGEQKVLQYSQRIEQMINEIPG